MNAMMRALAIAGALWLALLPAHAQQYPSGWISGNASIAPAPPRAISPSAWLDSWCALDQYSVPMRGAGEWECIAGANLNAIAGADTAADKLGYWTGAAAYDLTDFTAFARALLDDADAATARATLGVVIGTNVQAWDADLDALAALSGTNTIYYRSGAATWSSVTIGSLLAFSGGTLNITDLELVALAGLTSAADKLPYFTGSGTASVADFTAFGRSLVDDGNASAARTTLGVVIGTDVQAYHARLADIAGITFAQGDILYYNGSALVKLSPGTSGHFLQTQGASANPAWVAVPGGGDLLSTNNLSDVADAAAARLNIPALAFSAHKNGTDQTGIPASGGSTVKITFTSEAFDLGSYFDTVNSRWTPPAGPVRLTASVYLSVNVVDQAQSLLAIYKNGVLFKYVAISNASGTLGTVLNGSCIDSASGTDYYEVYFSKGGAGNGTISGNAAYTWFQGDVL